MVTIKRVKSRIKSAKNIAQITKGMQMVAASKMRKAQENALASMPYSDKIFASVNALAKRTKKEIHPLLKKKSLARKILIILISTNEGLCGSLNTNLFRYLDKECLKKERTDFDFITFGTKARDFLSRHQKNLIADFSTSIFVENVPAATKLFSEGFINNKYSRIELVYNHFISAIKQQPTRKIILPIGILEDNEKKKNESEKRFAEYLIEPSIDFILENLLPHYLEIQIHRSLLESEACEHSARMLAMKNATDNALALTTDLILAYNRLRQEKITYEIADMVTARQTVS